MTEYRIAEHLGEFTIEGKFKKTSTTGMLWWKKIYVKYVWNRVSKLGMEILYLHGFGYIVSPMPPFKTLKEAEAQIELLLKGITYHYHKRST